MKKNSKWAIPVLLILIFIAFDCFVVYACRFEQAKLDTMRHDGVVALNKIADVKDYRKKEAKKLKAIISDSEAVIEDARAQESIDEELSKATLKIKKLKTDKQYSKEEAEEKKRKLEAARLAAEEAARQEAARQAAAKTAKKSSGNRGCIGNDASNFY